MLTHEDSGPSDRSTLSDPTTTPARKPRQKRPRNPAALLLSPQSAEGDYGVPYTTLRDLANRGALPVVRFPGSRRWWFRRVDLDTLIARCAEVLE